MDSLQHKIDLNYVNKKRSSSLKWSIVNGVFLLVFVYDLSCKCAGYTSLLHYVELALAGVAAANLLRHAARLLRPGPAPPPPPPPRKAESPRRDASPARLEPDADASLLSLSLSPRWRSPSASPASTPSPHTPPSPHAAYSPPSPYSPTSTHSAYSPPSPHTPYSSHSPPSPRRDEQLPRDEFISDRRTLEDYLEQQARPRELPPTAPWPRAPAAPAPLYQLAAFDSEGSLDEGGAAAGAGGAPHVWRRLDVDPRRLTQYNLNLRLWIHLTILQRVVRELGAADAALAAAGLPELRPGAAPPERLRKAALAQGGALRALLPFLEPFPDQRYLVRRLRALAAGGCLSEYRWRGGGPDWRPGLPTDAELVLHLVATYLDLQLPAGAAPAPSAPEAPRPFSARHLSAAPAPPPRGPQALAIHRAHAAPPHYVLARGEDTLEAGAGRCNLLHVLLLFLAAAAQQDPPALQRVHLGPAALNMLWIIGR